jgi:hypothetical protein
MAIACPADGVGVKSLSGFGSTKQRVAAPGQIVPNYALGDGMA